MSNVGDRLANARNRVASDWPPGEMAANNDGEWGTDAADDEWNQVDQAVAANKAQKEETWSDNDDPPPREQLSRSGGADRFDRGDGFGGPGGKSENRNSGFDGRSRNMNYGQGSDGRAPPGPARGGFQNTGQRGHNDDGFNSRSNGFDGRSQRRNDGFSDRSFGYTDNRSSRQYNDSGYSNTAMGSTRSNNAYNNDQYIRNGNRSNNSRYDDYSNGYDSHGPPQRSNDSGFSSRAGRDNTTSAYQNDRQRSYEASRSSNRPDDRSRFGGERNGPYRAQDGRSDSRHQERREPPIGNRFQNSRNRPEEDHITSRPVYEATRPTRQQFGESRNAYQRPESYNPAPQGTHGAKLKRFEDIEAGRGASDQEQQRRNANPPSMYVPRETDVDTLYQMDRENARHSAVETDDISFENGTEPDNFEPWMTWDKANLPTELLENIIKCGYDAPRKIQAYTMPLVEHDYDVMGQAETGSGKSAAFLLPIIKYCMISKKKDDLRPGAPVAIIVCPTRELVSQLYDQGRKFADNCGVRVQRAYGEFNVAENARQIRLGCDILIATVGRLKQFVDDNTIKFDNLTHLVLDEADHLIETNHFDVLLDIIRHPKFPEIKNRQTLLFSATFSAEVELIASRILRKDRKVTISNHRKTSANTKITQKFHLVKNNKKKEELLKMLKKEMEIYKSVRRTIVFVQMKRQTDVIASYLTMSGITATTVHGDRSQKLREEAIRDFKGDIRVLVATDVCARGIDIQDLDHVVNFDLPSDKVTYIHRIGRTGRTREGLATSFFDPTNYQDQQIASELIEAATETEQEVPKFLIDTADGNYIDEDAETMAEQTERAFQKQPTVFLNRKEFLSDKTRPERYVRKVGLGFKAPREAIEGTFIDKKCPFTGNVAIRGRILTGVVVKNKMQRTIVIRRDYLHFVKKYRRYEKRHRNVSVHCSPAFR
ncbi:hypothetical protein QR680_004287 [Steinernema hermaphroditum]|uniref:Small ribosomal subunit protein uS17 n=1 Tax=Steinernema hermaphroditum TaxID=289476 RepID=A0AA39HQF2_9BILA|nr:hypothetical protein QR680_004287 [Steinernema hermaphroditum]